jgi:hypothetical protein
MEGSHLMASGDRPAAIGLSKSTNFCACPRTIKSPEDHPLHSEWRIVKTMSWFNRSKKNQSAMSKLSKKVFEMSVSCTETLAPDLEKKLGKESTLFTSKYLRVLFGFMYFFIHLTDRYAFD